MPINQEILAERLKSERKRLALTQEEVAEYIGVKRSAVVQLEAAKRAVTSIELSQLAVLYKRSAEYFLSETAPEEASSVMHLRANRDLDDLVRESLDKCVAICKAATSLEELLSISSSNVAFSYIIERPRSRWEAVDQGIQVAAMERKRLELGSSPLRNIVEIIARHGVRVAKDTMTTDISGFFFAGPETGMAILVNAADSPTRRLFSYAHEYAHLLLDKSHVSGVSRFGNREDLLEVRANTFAAHFLMPEEGVRAFLDNVGGLTRQVMEIYDGFEVRFGEDQNGQDDLVTAQRRSAPGSREVRMIDALRLARHFGTSYEAAVYQLLNLKIVQKETQEKLLSKKSQSEVVNSLLGIPPALLEQETMADLTQTMVGLVVEALLQKQITNPKAKEYMRLINRDPQELDCISPALSN
jgi:Zn-dependent peptidase ImmA (M78 family)/transcriptional regulator with XRE-family HTH domain